MAGKEWTDQEIDFIKENHQRFTCAEMSKKLQRTTRAVQHKYNQLGLEKRRAKVGEIVKGWEIVNIEFEDIGSQRVRMADIKSTVDDKKRRVRLSILSNNHIAYPIRKRPDNAERNTTHGQTVGGTHSRIYRIWSSMKNRCGKQDAYLNISVCEQWLDFRNFFNWASNNGYDETLSLDRIDRNGNYEPSNCRWANKITQLINRSVTKDLMITAFGETKHIIEWLHDKRCKTTNGSLRYRIRQGWEPETAITKPPMRKSKLNLKNWLKREYPDIWEEYQNST